MKLQIGNYLYANNALGKYETQNALFQYNLISVQEYYARDFMS